MLLGHLVAHAEVNVSKHVWCRGRVLLHPSGWGVRKASGELGVGYMTSDGPGAPRQWALQ